MKLLITGAAGQLSRMVARLLAQDHEVVGLDVRQEPKGVSAFPGTFISVKRYDHRSVAEVFRQHRPRRLVHLGVRGVDARSRDDYGYTQNVLGTRNLLAQAEKHGVRSVVALSTFHVYGAHQHNAVGIKEDAPLRASQIFPELVDAVELDHAVTTFMWRKRDIPTIVLRPVSIVGPALNNRMTRLLRSPRCPMLFGFDPMIQFLHEADAARAIVTAVHSRASGVYNVSGEGVVAWSHAIALAGGRPMKLPHVLAYPIIGLLSRMRLVFPKHLMDYFRYPVIVDDAAFREDFDWEPQHSTVDTLRAVGESRPAE